MYVCMYSQTHIPSGILVFPVFMYVHMYVCICYVHDISVLFLYICIYTSCTHTYLRFCFLAPQRRGAALHVYIHIYTYHACIHTYLRYCFFRPRKRGGARACIHTHIYTYIHTFKHKYIPQELFFDPATAGELVHVYIHIYTHINTHSSINIYLRYCFLAPQRRRSSLHITISRHTTSFFCWFV
jgi:hypothetical protein